MRNDPNPLGDSPNERKRSAGVPPSASKIIDFAESARFFSLLDADVDRFLFSAHDDDNERVKGLTAAAKANGKPKPATFQSRVGSIDDDRVRGWIAERQAAGWGVTVSAQAMKGGRRQATDVAYLRVVFAEMDIGEPLQPWPLEPSILVETSPGRYHVYWSILAEAPITEEEFHGIMMRVCETYGSDPNAKDLARTLRLPGTWNLKPEREPHLAKVICETGARYSREELLTAFPPPPKREAKPTGPRPIFNGHAPPGLERFYEPLKAVPPENYSDWLRVGQALAHETGKGADGLQLWEEWSGQSSKWAPGVCAEKWDTFNGSGITGGTIFALAEAHGYIRPVRGPRISIVKPAKQSRQNGGAAHDDAHLASGNAADDPSKNEGAPPQWPEVGKGKLPRGRSQPNIRAFVEWRGVQLAHNTFTMRELATIDGEQREIDDDVLRSLWLEADRLGLIAPEKFFVSVVLDLAHQRSFHPVREYLDALRWDCKPRVDRWLVTYAGATDSSLVRAFGSKQLLAAVQRVRQPGAKHDAILVLEGPQGIGKSQLIRALAGDEWYSDAMAVGEESRKVIELTSGVWLGEIAELKGLGHREAEQVKAMLSRQSDRARLAYGRTMTDRPRQFVLFGSVNDSQYLRDLTGNRRFWPVRCGAIDVEGLRRDRDQIWAEVAHRQALGECTALPPDLWADAAAEQEQRVLTDPWQMTLEPLLEGKVGHIEIAHINQRLGLEPKHQNGQVGQRIAAIMTRLGFTRTRLRRGRTRVYAYSNVKLGMLEAAEWIVL